MTLLGSWTNPLTGATTAYGSHVIGNLNQIAAIIGTTVSGAGTLDDDNFNPAPGKELQQSKVSALVTALALKAPLASPTFTGTVTVDTGATLAVDTIAEKTPANGVDIDQMTVLDKGILVDTIAEKTGAAGVSITGLKADTIVEKTGAAGVSITGLKADTIVEKTGAAGVSITGLKANTVAEVGAGVGVTVDGVTCKDGGVTTTAPNDWGGVRPTNTGRCYGFGSGAADLYPGSGGYHYPISVTLYAQETTGLIPDDTAFLVTASCTFVATGTIPAGTLFRIYIDAWVGSMTPSSRSRSITLADDMTVGMSMTIDISGPFIATSDTVVRVYAYRDGGPLGVVHGDLSASLISNV